MAVDEPSQGTDPPGTAPAEGPADRSRPARPRRVNRRTLQARAGARGTTGILTQYGSRISRETAIYAVGMGMVFPLGFIQVAIFTHVLAPAAFGQLGVLFTFAAMVTLLMNTGSLQGVFMWTFGSAGDADGADVSVDFDDPDAAGAVDKRRAMGTGLLMTIGICTAMAVPLILFSRWVAGLLLGDPSKGNLVVWACISAALGALWRLVVTALRHERRPVLYSVAQMIRPIAVVAIAAPLVIDGYGAHGALVGTALGSAVGILFCFAVDYRSYSLQFSREDAVKMLQMGGAFVFIVVGLWIVHDADIYLVSWYSSHTATGLYRLASRVATLPSYLVSAFMFAQSSLERSMLFHATYERRGHHQTKSTLLTYYLFCALWLVLGLTVGADLLVHIASSSYRGAAAYIPLLGVAYACYGGYVVIIRAAQVPRRRLVYACSALTAGALFVGLAIVLIPLIGPYGAPVGEVVGLVSVSLFLLWLMRRVGQPLGVQTGRIFRGAAVCGFCYLLGGRLAPALGYVRWPLELASVLVYPVLLVASGAIPREHVRPLLRIAQATLPRRRRTPLLQRVDSVPPRRRAVLEAIVRDRRPPALVAAEQGLTVDEVGVRLTRALRQLAGAGDPGAKDGLLGRYLLSDDGPAQRDAQARELALEGIDPLDIHELDTALTQLRRTPRRVWAHA